MKLPLQTISRNRFLEIDALRGFALVAIFIYHFITYFNFPSTYVETNQFLIKTDYFVNQFSYYFLSGKAFPIFAFLFGFTFYVQHKRTKRDGTNYSHWFIWRMILLFCFGIVNSVFFPEGDILVLYSLTGLLFLPLRNSPTWIFVTISIVLLLQPVQLYQIVNGLSDPSFQLSANYSDIFKDEIDKTLLTGSLGEIVRVNLVKGVPASLMWQYESGRMAQIVGVFVLGIVAGRLDLFNASRFRWRFWMRIMISLIPVIAIIFLMKKAGIYEQESATVRQLSDMVSQLWLNLFLTFFIISSFILMYHLNKGRLLHPFTYLGKMSLTAYITQSIIGALIFLPYGLGLANKIGITECFILAIIILTIQGILSRWWLKTHDHGPLETIWIKLAKTNMLAIAFSSSSKMSHSANS